MPTNLVTAVTKLLTPDTLSRLASGLGFDQTSVEKAASAGVPGLLAALVSNVAKPGGATMLGNAVAQQQPGLLSSLTNIIGSSGQNDLIESGMGTLSSLLGPSTMAVLTNAVRKYAGLDESASKGLMGFLGPLVMGVLGQQQRSAGLDASGLAQLLLSQKDNIARALPAGFSRYLSGTGILDQVPGSASMQRAGEDDSAASPWSAWLVPALCVAALIALGAYLIGPRATKEVATAPPAFTVTAEEVGNWTGKPVYSSDNKKIGEVVEIVRGPDNKLTEVVADTGTVLGMGAKRYRIASEKITEMKPDGVVVSLTESEVKSAPPASESHPQ
jgi:hypothetical protein